MNCMGLVGAPGATLILMSPVPRAQLSDADLAAFRQLADVQRDVARAFRPRCVFLDVERLLQAEKTASGSWRRRLTLHDVMDGPAEPMVTTAAVDVWSVEPLPRAFPRLQPTDYDGDGVHLHPVHYMTIRHAVEENAVLAALLRTPPHKRLSQPIAWPLPPADHVMVVENRGGDGDGGGRGTDTAAEPAQPGEKRGDAARPASGVCPNLL